MFLRALTADARAVLEKLTSHDVCKGFYLAGGTGAALQLGHRRSEDFDFFSAEDFSPENRLARLVSLGDVEVVNQTAGTLNMLFDGVRVSFLHYSYPLLKPTHLMLGVEVADLIDIALMKVAAIAGRGSKKDFVDLYFICNAGPVSLETLPRLFAEKFKSVNYSSYHIARSLTFFDDAEPDPLPEMFAKVSWEEVKAFFAGAQKELEGWYA